MKKLYYPSKWSFANQFDLSDVKSSNEGTICFNGDKVIKILDNLITFYEIPNLESTYLKRISKLDSDLITVPKELIYIGGKYKGYTMQYAGDNLWDLLLDGKLSLSDKIQFCYDIKNIVEYIRSKKFLHGDIRLENFVFDGDKTRLTDINNMMKIKDYKKTSMKLRMPELYEVWERNLDVELLDCFEANYCMFILLSNNQEILKKIYERKSAVYSTFDKFIELESDCFDISTWNYYKSVLDGDNIEGFTRSYMIDHIKR